MIKLGFVGPGDFSNGWDSLVRGEGRWLMSIIKSLKDDPNYDTTLIVQDHGDLYNYNDSFLGTKFRSIKSVLNGELNFDILFSMDVYEDEIADFHKSNMSKWVSKIKTKQRVWAPFFSSKQHLESKYPVVYPYFYKEADLKKLFTLPIALGTIKDLSSKKINNFNKKNAVWFSKNSHENPEFLFESLQNCLDHLNKIDGFLVMVDGKWLHTKEYKDKEKVVSLLDKNKTRVCLLDKWIPYSKMKSILDKSQFICGIHHPIVNPMQLDIVFSGGIPIIFNNQKELPPFNDTQLPYIDGKNTEDGFYNMYHRILVDETSYNLVYYTLVQRSFLYTEEECKENLEFFIEKL